MVPYVVDEKYKRSVAYLSMEFALDQSLKIYSGGLGFLAGSHMKSAYELKQNLIGIGILWKYGYYDQVRAADNSMAVLWQEKQYNFLEDTGILLEIKVSNHPVKAKVYYLDPETFQTAPMYFLSTDIPENDALSRTITHNLYDSNVETKVAQCILLGRGGVKLTEALGFAVDTFHMNEAHAVAGALELYEHTRDLHKVREKFVFTTHTPVEAGNEKHSMELLERMSFFGNLSMQEVKELLNFNGDVFTHTLAALRLSRIANGVSVIHGDVAREMWGGFDNICPITSITNSQNQQYWQDPKIKVASAKKDLTALAERKTQLKEKLFKIVADQTGKWWDPKVFTLVWARRFAEYKRAELITRDLERFEALLSNVRYPIQILWAGKPYPKDYGAVNTFNHLVQLCKKYPNATVLTGYELQLSRQVKLGSDLWLNNPRIPREASGTSGMTAAMNGCVNLSTWDGWIPEFVQNGRNGFVVPPADVHALSHHEQDEFDRNNLLDVLEQQILPLYYDQPEQWWQIAQQSIEDVTPQFCSNRMADEYYAQLYSYQYVAQPTSVEV
jgi:glycogen phosphorylase